MILKEYEEFAVKRIIEKFINTSGKNAFQI